MDTEQFDRLVKKLGAGHSRRTVIRGIAAGALSAGSALVSVGSRGAGAQKSAASQAQRNGRKTLAGKELDPLYASAMNDSDTQKIDAYITSHGFRASLEHSRGFADADGTTGLILNYIASDGSNDLALISWNRAADGRQAVQGDMVHYLATPAAIKGVEDAKRTTKTTGLAIDAHGQIQIVDDFWSCWWDHIFSCCGPAAWGCYWSGPGYLACLLGICDICIWYADAWCSFNG